MHPGKILQRYSVRLRIYLWFMKYLPPQLASTGVITVFPMVTLIGANMSQRPDPNEKQVINLDQDMQVCGYFWWMVEELLCMISLSPIFFFDMGYIFFLPFFSTCLL